MKYIIYVLAAVFTFNVSAQSTKSSMHSSANYKMPLHSKKAKADNLDNATQMDYKSSEKQGGNSAANYKNSFNKSDNSGADVPVVAPSNEVGIASEAHYKSKFGKKSKKNKNGNVEPAQEPVVAVPSYKDLD